MLVRDYDQRPPASDAVKGLLPDLQVTYEETQIAAVDDLLAAMRIIYANGDAQYASFFLGPSAVLDYFAPRDQLDEIDFWRRMLESDAVAQQLPWLGDTYFDRRPVTFHPLSAYYLDGDLAETLMKGGAYLRFPGTAAEAKGLGRDFCTAVFANRFDEMLLRKTKDAWAAWFEMAPWDNTWLGLDRRTRRFWLLCTRDID